MTMAAVFPVLPQAISSPPLTAITYQSQDGVNVPCSLARGTLLAAQNIFICWSDQYCTLHLCAYANKVTSIEFIRVATEGLWNAWV